MFFIELGKLAAIAAVAAAGVAIGWRAGNAVAEGGEQAFDALRDTVAQGVRNVSTTLTKKAT